MSNPTELCLPHAIVGLLHGLPPPGTVWPEVERAKFLCAFGAVLDLLYKEPPRLEVAPEHFERKLASNGATVSPTETQGESL